jgi:hypothetical protein
MVTDKKTKKITFWVYLASLMGKFLLVKSNYIAVKSERRYFTLLLDLSMG